MIKENRGLARRIKKFLPTSVFQVTRRILNWLAARIPHSLKYGIGTYFKRHKYPYSLIEPKCTVIQVGAPADLIFSGRSRALTFTRLAPNGLVVILEPDPHNCEVIVNYCRRYKIGNNIKLVQQGAWSTEDTLAFYSSREHPSSNFLIGTNEADERTVEQRKYQIIEIPVTSLDSVVRSLGLDISRIRLISITTNGAEKEILKGMESLLDEASPYICLAETGEEYIQTLEELGYTLLAYDDRGFTFAPGKLKH